MAIRALIIAIQEYKNSQERLAKTLAGTNEAGQSFRRWLIERKRVDPTDVYFCASSGCEGRTADTTSDAINNEIERLLASTREASTEELYVYFSGHGFNYPTAPFGSAVDILVSSDYRALGNSGHTCFDLQKLRQLLWYTLGPGDHYYFIDACRNLVKENHVTPAGLRLASDQSELGKPSTYVLFSTRQGETASVKSGFSIALLNGLGGGGRAKIWLGSDLYVTFDQLFMYMRQKLNDQRPVRSPAGDGEGLILKLDPLAKYPQKIEVVNASPSDKFKLTVKQIRELGAGKDFDFEGARCQINLLPDDYFLKLSSDVSNIIQVHPPPKGSLDFYEPGTVRFQKEDTPSLGTASSLLTIATESGISVSLENVYSGKTTTVRLSTIPTDVDLSKPNARRHSSSGTEEIDPSIIDDAAQGVLSGTAHSAYKTGKQSAKAARRKDGSFTKGGNRRRKENRVGKTEAAGPRSNP